MSLFKLSAAFQDYLWGGTKLKDEYNKKTDLSKVAESWELSAHQAGLSKIASGEYRGLSFSEYLDIKGSEIIGTKASSYIAFPLLIKFIDAQAPLSIQVHPDDDYALKHEHDYGKTEMWYIVETQEDAFLYIGFNRDVTEEKIKESIVNNTLPSLLNKVPVKKGEVYLIEPGTIHAINGGILLVEIQENSNITYRVYDYDRKDAKGNSRPLHIQKALDVLNLAGEDVHSTFDGPKQEKDGYSIQLMKDCSRFKTYLACVDTRMNIAASKESFTSILVLDGSGTVCSSDDTVEFTKGDSIFVDACDTEITINGKCQIIITTL